MRQRLKHEIDYARMALVQAESEEDSVRRLGFIATAQAALDRARAEADFELLLERPPAAEREEAKSDG